MQTVSQAKVQVIPLTHVVLAPQVRTQMDKQALAELADDMRANGVLQPVLVRAIAGGKYRVIAGHRRIAAAQIAELKTVPALVREADDDEALMMQLSENLHREDLSLADTAAAVRKIFDQLGDLDAVAAFVGKSKPWVSKHLAVTVPNLAWPARRVLEDGACDDLEIINAISQAAGIGHEYGDELAELVRGAKIDREGARQFVKDARTKRESARELAAAQEKARQLKAKQRTQKFKPADAATTIYFSMRAGGTIGQELKLYDGAQQAAILGFLKPYHDQGTADIAEIRGKLHKGQSASAAAWPLLVNAEILSNAVIFATYTAGVMGVQLDDLGAFFERMFSYSTEQLVSPAKPQAAAPAKAEKK